MKKLVIFFALVTNINLFSQAPPIKWENSYGGSNSDQASVILQTSDGGYIVGGSSQSLDGDVLVHSVTNLPDYWILKLDSSGAIQWQKTYGGSYFDVLLSMRQTSDKGFIVAGYSSSNDGQAIGNHGGIDYWLLKLDSLGIIQWKKCYGGSNNDVAYCTLQTKDGGFIFAGSSESNNLDVSGNHGVRDYWVLKLNPIGNIQWEKSYGGTHQDVATSIDQSSDGGYIIAGWSLSNDGNISSHHGGADTSDYWVVKIDSVGILQWEKSFGGFADDEASAIIKTNGGYLKLAIQNRTMGM